MSLRSRLLVGLGVLVAIGLGLAAVVTYEEQRSFLFTRLDQQVVTSYPAVADGLGLLPRGVSIRGTPPVPPRRRPISRGAVTVQASGTYGVLLGPDGRVLTRRTFTYGQPAASPPRLPAHMAVSRFTSPVRLSTVDSQAGSSLRYRVTAFAVSGGRTLVVAVPLREVDQTLQRLILVEALVGGGLIIALVVLGWLVIRLGLRPLERIGQVASDIAHGDLSRRVTPATPRTEVGRLGLSLNEMLVQIERAFADRRASEDRLRQFLADASHELRTPLASIRGYAELFRLGATADPGALENAMARIESEAARMGVLVEDLLLLASLDEMPELRRDPVELRALAEQTAQDVRAIAPLRDVRLIAREPLYVLADPDKLRQVLANLTRNAVTHTPPDSPIELSVWRQSENAIVEVRDHGPGLPADAADRVFDRFWRREGGRSRGAGGAGLGLAIVRAIVHAHHGEVHAQSDPDGGAVFRVVLPVAPDAPTASAAQDPVGDAVAPA